MFCTIVAAVLQGDQLDVTNQLQHRKPNAACGVANWPRNDESHLIAVPDRHRAACVEVS